MSRKEGKKKLSVICVEVMVKGTRGNEGAERSGVHDEEQLPLATCFAKYQSSTVGSDQ